MLHNIQVTIRLPIETNWVTLHMIILNFELWTNLHFEFEIESIYFFQYF